VRTSDESETSDEQATEKELWEFASARSHEASKASYDLCKSIAQACLLINGGAATAVIALLAKDRVDVALLTYIPWGLGPYAAGVVVSAFMLYRVMMTAENWNYFWYHSSYDIDEKEAASSEKLGRSWQKWMNNTFGFAIGCFLSAAQWLHLECPALLRHLRFGHQLLSRRTLLRCRRQRHQIRIQPLRQIKVRLSEDCQVFRQRLK